VHDVQFKEELMIAMGLNTEEEGSPMAFFRRGYKVTLVLLLLCTLSTSSNFQVDAWGFT
jgi:hypothetical protein